MVSTFFDYQSRVLEDYEERKQTLSFRLAHPTTARLRDECRELCEKRFALKDQKILRDFFGYDWSNLEMLKQVILDLDIDRFRPVENFLKKGTTKPNERVVELVAWLIDFEPRPFDPKNDYISKPKTNTTERSSLRATGAAEDAGNKSFPPEVVEPPTGAPPNFDYKENPVIPVFPEIPPRKAKSRKAVIIAILILLPASIAAYWLLGNKKCMYWAGDHYEPISCNQTLSGTTIIPLDAQKLRYFKKILRRDTITKKAIGAVWYAKTNGGDSIEFFTSDGSHPVDTRLKLKPITPYIIKHHIDSNKSSK